MRNRHGCTGRGNFGEHELPDGFSLFVGRAPAPLVAKSEDIGDGSGAELCVEQFQLVGWQEGRVFVAASAAEGQEFFAQRSNVVGDAVGLVGGV